MLFNEVGDLIDTNYLDISIFTLGEQNIGNFLDMSWLWSCSTLL